MKVPANILTFIIVLFMSNPSFATGDKAIQISGDPCSLPLMKKLVEGYTEKVNSKFKAEFSTVGCMMGVYMAANNKSDIGVSTQNGLQSNLPKDAELSVIGKAPIVLVVNKNNPVNNLSYKDIQGIFSGKIKNWKELGGNDLEIKNVMLEPCVRHTMSKKVLPYGKDITKLVPEKKGNPVLHTNAMVAKNQGAIGQQLYGYEDGSVKVLTIDGVLPDNNTITSGKYPFFEEYNIVTRGKSEGEIKELVRFAYSTDGKKIMQSMKHVPAE